MKKLSVLLLISFFATVPPIVNAGICDDASFTHTLNQDTLPLPQTVITNKSKAEQETSIQDLTTEADRGLNELHNKLDDNASFHGLYVTGAASQRTPDNAHQGYLGLEWQIFRLGYINGKHKAELNKTNALIDAYTLRRHLRAQSLDQALLQVKRMQNALLDDLYNQMLTQQTRLTTVYRKRMKAGFVTRQALLQEESSLQNIQDKVSLYEQLPKTSFPQDLANLINHIDLLRLQPLAELEEKALSQSDIEQLQQLISRHAKLTTPRWSDNLTVGIYARHRTDYIGPTGNEMGIQFDIPLDGNTSNDKLVQLRDRLHNIQLKADKIRLREKLASLSDQFLHAQDAIRQLQNSYHMSLSQASMDCTQSRHTVPTLENTPEKSLEQFPVALLSQQRDIFVARLDAYRLLLQLQAMVQPTPGEDWYSTH